MEKLINKIEAIIEDAYYTAEMAGSELNSRKVALKIVEVLEFSDLFEQIRLRRND